MNVRSGPAATERFASLDLLRGVAALSVLAWHSTWPSGVRPPFGRGYLAVDLFFVLSGFVIAHAYERRLGTRAQFGQFLRARLIRLYPMFCIAALLEATVMIVVARFGRNPQFSVGAILPSLAPTLLFIPPPRAWSFNPQMIFPLVFTAWSLFWELWVNLVYGLVWRMLRGAHLAIPIGLGALAIGYGLYGTGNFDRGWAWDGFWFGAARALFSFFAGVAIFRFRKSKRAPQVPALVIAAILLVLLTPRTWGGWSYEAACVFLAFPLLVWFGADATLGERVRSVGTFLGFLSYPVYLLQAPFEFVAGALETRLTPWIPLISSLDPLTYVTVTIAGSWAIARWIDAPLRLRLRRSFAAGAPQPSAQTAP